MYVYVQIMCVYAYNIQGVPLIPKTDKISLLATKVWLELVQSLFSVGIQLHLENGIDKLCPNEMSYTEYIRIRI